MLSSLGFAGLLGILGTFAAVLWTFVLVIGGAPGSALVGLGARYRKRVLIRAGTTLTFLLDAYLLLAFAGLVTRFVAGVLLPRPTLPAWPLWLVGWYLATAPVLFSGRRARGVAARDAADTAYTLALPLAAAGFWVFVLWPELVDAGWRWLPSFRL